jgi:hypothetical protein
MTDPANKATEPHSPRPPDRIQVTTERPGHCESESAALQPLSKFVGSRKSVSWLR